MYRYTSFISWKTGSRAAAFQQSPFLYNTSGTPKAICKRTVSALQLSQQVELTPCQERSSVNTQDNHSNVQLLWSISRFSSTFAFRLVCQAGKHAFLENALPWLNLMQYQIDNTLSKPKSGQSSSSMPLSEGSNDTACVSAALSLMPKGEGSGSDHIILVFGKASSFIRKHELIEFPSGSMKAISLTNDLRTMILPYQCGNPCKVLFQTSEYSKTPIICNVLDC
jgi:hypothetical protein